VRTMTTMTETATTATRTKESDADLVEAGGPLAAGVVADEHVGDVAVLGRLVEHLALAAEPLHVEPLDALAASLERAGRVLERQLGLDHQECGLHAPPARLALGLTGAHVGQRAVTLLRVWRRVTDKVARVSRSSVCGERGRRLQRAYLMGGPMGWRAALLPPPCSHHRASVVVRSMSGLRSRAQVSHAVSETPSPSLQ
jgi:hypothetical protein